MQIPTSTFGFDSYGYPASGKADMYKKKIAKLNQKLVPNVIKAAKMNYILGKIVTYVTLEYSIYFCPHRHFVIGGLMQ
jgi:hypothetical protein